MSKAQQILQRLTIVATAAVYAMRIVSNAGAHALNKAVGVAETDVSLGDAIGVITHGEALVLSGGVFAAGDKVTSNATGYAVKADPATIAAGEMVEVLGIAKDASTGSGQQCLVLINPHTIVGVKDDTITIAAGETITANQIVDSEGKHTANRGIGIAQNGGASGVDIVIKLKGTATVKSGAAFAIGDKLTSDSAGKAIKYDPANVNVGTVIDIIGTALAAASAADESISVLLGNAVGVGTKAAG